MRILHGTSGTSRGAGFTLIECIVYMAVLGIVLGLAFEAYYQCMKHSQGIRRNSEDIIHAMNVGERWRDDVHRARGVIEVIQTTEGPLFQITQAEGVVTYRFMTNAVLRQSKAGGPWLVSLANVEQSRMMKDTREEVFSWRWELEFQSKKKDKSGLKPQFTFQAVSPLH